VCCVTILEQRIALPVLKDLQRYFISAILSDKINPCGNYTNIIILIQQHNQIFCIRLPHWRLMSRLPIIKCEAQNAKRWVQLPAGQTDRCFINYHVPFNLMNMKMVYNILIYIQQDATLHSLLYLETALHVLGGTITHHQERKQLYLQHLVSVTPLLLSATIGTHSTLKPVSTLPR